jgi:hypothetical protein
MRANKHQDALKIYLDLGRLEAFDLIEKQNLFHVVKVRLGARRFLRFCP